MITPLERNGRRLIGVLAEYFPAGTTCEDLRRRFEKETCLSRQSFYDALKFVKGQGWLVADEKIYNLDPAGSWKPPTPSIGEQLDTARRENDRLDHVAALRAERLEELRSQVENLRDWASGSNGVAVSNLVQILSDTAASPRQKLRAAAAILGYKVQNPDIAEFAKAFLEQLCASGENIDYRVEAAELLRRAEGDAQLRPSIERLTPPTPPRDREAEEAGRRIVSERRRKHLEEQSRLDQERLRQEWKQQGWTWPASSEA
jgi:hypothetical protein